VHGVVLPVTARGVLDRVHDVLAILVLLLHEANKEFQLVLVIDYPAMCRVCHIISIQFAQFAQFAQKSPNALVSGGGLGGNPARGGGLNKGFRG